MNTKKAKARAHFHRRRNSSGTATIELACGSLFLVVLTLLALDITILMLGFEVNDRACRDACRAAAQQASADEARTAAEAILKSHKTDGFFLGQPILKTGASQFVYNDFGGDPSLGNPTVTVTTEIECHTPVPLNFCGSSFGHDGMSWVSDRFKFQKRYTFPIVTFSLVLNNS